MIFFYLYLVCFLRLQCGTPFQYWLFPSPLQRLL
jgi:hypothetical protein